MGAPPSPTDPGPASHSTTDMLAARRFLPAVCGGLRTRAIHQSASVRNDNDKSSLPVETKELSVTENVMSMTGKTGPIIAAGAIGTFAYANELLLFHSESVVVITFGAMIYGLYTKGADAINGMINEQKSDARARYDVSKNQALEGISDEVAHLKSQLDVESTMAMRYEASKEIASAQEELFYRKRNNDMVADYKKFLDSAAATAMAERKAEQNRIVDALENDFLASFNAAADKLVVDKCIADLQTVKF